MFGDNLKKYRLSNNLSQSELAAKLYVSRQCVSKWEKGKTQPDIDTINKISELLNVSADDLLKEKTAAKATGGAGKLLFILNIFAGVFCVSAFIALWKFMPEKIPAHWTNGVLDRYGSRNEILLNIITALIFTALDVGIYAAAKRIADRRGLYIAHGVILFFQAAYLTFIFVLYCKYLTDVLSFITCLSSSILLCVSVAMHPKISKPNLLLGVRTSDTLKSPEIWQKTNALACYLFAALSFMIYIIALLCGLRFPFLLLLLYIVPTIAVVIYAKLLSRKNYGAE